MHTVSLNVVLLFSTTYILALNLNDLFVKPKASVFTFIISIVRFTEEKLSILVPLIS